MGVRIVAGDARGRRLEAPEGEGTRPTADRVKQAVFDILGQSFDGGEVLDLYAGSGALALEALSRGMAKAVCVEKDPAAAAIARKNAAALRYEARVEVLELPVERALPRLASRRFDLVFVDPPYASGPGAALALLGEAGCLAPTATVVAEHDKRTETRDRYGALVRTDVRTFGDTAVSFFDLVPGAPRG